MLRVQRGHVRLQHLLLNHAGLPPAPKAKTDIDPLNADSPRSLWEYEHLEDEAERSFLRALHNNQPSFSTKMLEKMAVTMLQSETFDLFMSKRFAQVKRYGLEGGEGLLVAVSQLLSDTDYRQFVIAMAHRGRLNLLTGVLGYPLEALFAKLNGARELPVPGSGDVLSHLWLDRCEERQGTKRRTILLPNSSHLEAVNPVQLGVCRGLSVSECLPIQIHGDASFAGQGIVQETLMLSRLPGFTVRGAVHIVLNNQLGFTTPPVMGRSSRFASDPLKMIGSPVLHVSGDDPVEISRAVSAAAAYRKQFGKDVGVDIVCYRKMGHNELDEPSFTQPVMYRKIRERPQPGTKFAQSIQLVHGILSH